MSDGRFFAEAEESFQASGDAWRHTGSLNGQFTALVNVAVARELDGRLAEALEALLNASDLAGDDAWSNVFLLTNMVGVLAKLRRYEEAITLFEKAVGAMDRGNPDHLYRAAEAAAEIGRFHDAVGLLAAMIRIVSGADGTDYELVMRFRTDLRLGDATLRAVAFVEGYERQVAKDPVPVDPDFEAVKLEVMEEWAPLRERANGAILEH